MQGMVGLLAAAGLAFAASASAQTPQEEPGSERHKALGIGGLFVRAEDPAALTAWYDKHLGINPVPKSYEDTPWMQEAGPTIFAPAPQDADGIIPKGKSWMLNLRVADIEAFVDQLKAEGVAVDLDPTAYPNGRFASLVDPEGNPIQLWEFKAP